MKKLIYTLSLSALVLGACVPLDTPPYDRETDLTFWSEDKNAALDALNTCYTYLTDMYELVYSDGMTDIAQVIWLFKHIPGFTGILPTGCTTGAAIVITCF